jgi:hypothetical protein
VARIRKVPEPPRKIESLPERIARWLDFADRVLGNPVEHESETESAKEQQRRQPKLKKAS